MNGAAKFFLAAGLLLAGLTALTMPYQPREAPERIISWVNLGIGLLMAAIAMARIVRTKKKDRWNGMARTDQTTH